MQYYISIVQQFVVTQVLDVCWRRFDEALAGEVRLLSQTASLSACAAVLTVDGLCLFVYRCAGWITCGSCIPISWKL
jgi:hypothetical protein